MLQFARLNRIRNITVDDLARLCWSKGFQYNQCRLLLMWFGFSPIQSWEEFSRVWNKLDQDFGNFCNEHGCPADPIGFADLRN
ncbi:hypothetical protein [Pseudomonas phage vB_PaeP_FMD5]|nr:hypothetical protein PWJ_gp07 [Pseudomonas phage PWJ]